MYIGSYVVLLREVWRGVALAVIWGLRRGDFDWSEVLFRSVGMCVCVGNFDWLINNFLPRCVGGCRMVFERLFV